MNDVYFVEYSAYQKCFHVETVERAVTQNARMVREGKRPSYVPIGIVASHEDGMRMIEDFKALGVSQ